MIGSKYFVARSIQKNKFRQKVAYLFYVERARPLKQVKITTVASFNNSAPSHLQFDNLNNRYHNTYDTYEMYEYVAQSASRN